MFIQLIKFFGFNFFDKLNLFIYKPQKGVNKKSLGYF